MPCPAMKPRGPRSPQPSLWRLWLLGLLLSACAGLPGQALAQYPPGMEWREIQGRSFRVVFPKEAESQALAVGSLLERHAGEIADNLEVEPRPISIYLNNRAAVANGYVALAPEYASFNLQPPATARAFGSADWLSLLTVHEYRHVVHNTAFLRGWEKVGSLFFGDYGRLLFRYSLPAWFVEGDAILAETQFTQGGRGRAPWFDMHYRSLLVNDLELECYPARFGSYRHFYPNHYHLGYVLAAHGRAWHGADLWANVLRANAWRSFWPYAFSLSLKKHSGLNEREFFEETRQRLREQWMLQVHELDMSIMEQKNEAPKKFWTSYEQPQYLQNHQVVVLKSGLDQPRQIVLLDERNQETVLRTTRTEHLSAGGSMICWTESTRHPRWERETYSDIYLMEAEEGKARRLTRRGRFFSPSLSPEGDRLAAIRFKTNGQCDLVVMETATGKTLWEYPNLENYLLRNPCWDPSGQKLALTLHQGDLSSLALLNLTTGRLRLLTDWKPVAYDEPQFYQQYIIFNSPELGLDNLHAIDTVRGIESMVIRSKFGAANACVLENKLVFQDYGPLGYDLSEVELRPQGWFSVRLYFPNPVLLFDKAAQQEKSAAFASEALPFQVLEHRAAKDLLNFHSAFFNLLGNRLDLTAVSEDALGRMTLMPAYSRDFRLQTSTLSLFARWNQSYLRPGLRVSTDDRRLHDLDLDWTEQSARVSLDLPLNFSTGSQTSSLLAQVGAGLTRYSFEPGREFFGRNSGRLAPAWVSLSFGWQVPQALRDLGPRRGVRAEVLAQTSALAGDFRASQLSASLQGLLWGGLPNTSLRLKAMFESQSVESYLFSFRQSVANGLPRYLEQFRALEAEYHFPILAPDLSLGPVLYLKRVWGSLGGARWHESTRLFELDYQARSAWLRLDFETHLLALEAPVVFGLGIAETRGFDSLENGTRFFFHTSLNF